MLKPMPQKNKALGIIKSGLRMKVHCVRTVLYSTKRLPTQTNSEKILRRCPQAGARREIEGSVDGVVLGACFSLKVQGEGVDLAEI